MTGVTEPSYSHGASEVPLLGETIGANLRRVAATYPDREAVVDVPTGQRWTYARFDADTDALARGLIAAGIEAGDRVGIWAPNCPEWVLLQYATAKAGIVLVNINPAYRSTELGYFFACWELPGLGWSHGIIPDAVFSLAHHTFAVEFDRGKEGIRYFIRTKIGAYRHLIDGRRPPAPPVYEALVSGAAHRIPWEELKAELAEANGVFGTLLGLAARQTPAPGVTIRTILIINRTLDDGSVEPEQFDAELGWKGYALTARLHLLDHRTQVRKLLRARGESQS